jgi:hypothetical protein
MKLVFDGELISPGLIIRLGWPEPKEETNEQ